MSFRELRNFTEQLRALGYPRHVSMENFRTPNFLLVADVLTWLVERYDPNIELPDDISTEQDRVTFLRQTCQVMAARARVKINPKRLYGADGYAVKELLKISNILHQATIVQADAEPDAESTKLSDFNVQSRLSEVKTARSLAAEIVESGAKVYALLEKENDTRAARKKAEQFLDAVSRNLDSNTESELIERRLREQVEEVTTSVNTYSKMSKNLEEDEKNLEAKIEKKRQELERTQKRLKSLQSVRPVHMDEYEKLEAELAKLYVVYLERFRNLEYLDHELEALNVAEKEKMDAADDSLRKMQKRLRDEELQMLRGEQMLSDDDSDDDGVGRGGRDDDSDDDDDDDGMAGRNWGGGRGGGGRPDGPQFLQQQQQQRPQAAPQGAARPGTVHGSMVGGGIDDGSSDSDSEDSAVLSANDGHSPASGGAGVGGHLDDDDSDGGQLIDDDDDDEPGSDDLIDDDDTISENDF